MENQPKEFKCRICGSDKYNENREHNGIIGPGSNSTIISYSCGKCSVMFTDLELFSITKLYTHKIKKLTFKRI